jgi:hypothetical protein
MATTTSLLATKIEASQSQKEVTANAAFDVFDKAIAGRLSKAITTADVTLTDDEARNAVIELTGTLTGNRNLIVPTRTKVYLVYNNTGGAFSVTVKTAAGTGVAVNQGTKAVVYCDGTNVVMGIGVFGASGANHAPGLVPSPGGSAGTTKFLREDGSWQVPPGTAGSGDSTRKAAYGSLPAASNDGDLFFPTNGFAVERDTGAAYEAWGPLLPLSRPPALSGFAWVNQGTSTASESKGAIELVIPGNSGDNLRILKKSAPATPYSISAAFLATFVGKTFVRGGLCWRESSSGKVVDLSLHYGSSGWAIDITKWNGVTSFSANYDTTSAMICAPLLWLRIADDGTNRKCSLSMDGQNWIEFHSVTRTDFMTPDEIGFMANINNVNYSAALTLVSWAQA